MDFQPLNGRVLIERDAPKTSQGGVELPDSVQVAPATGTIRASADDELSINLRVLFSQHAGYDLLLGGIKYRLIRKEDILGIVGESIGEVVISG
jgi:co-chaperonin GroES (HSP10)